MPSFLQWSIPWHRLLRTVLILYEVSCFCADIIHNYSRLVICLAFGLRAVSLVAAHSIPLIFVWLHIPPNPHYPWCLNPMLQDFEQPRSTTNQIRPRPSSHSSSE